MFNQMKKISVIAMLLGGGSAFAEETTIQGILIHNSQGQYELVAEDATTLLDVKTFGFAAKAASYEDMHVEVVGEKHDDRFVVTKKLENLKGAPEDGDDIIARLTGKNIVTPFALKDRNALEKLLVGLVQKYENRLENRLPNNSEDDLSIVIEEGESLPCEKIKNSKDVQCEVYYSQDRWNGTMRLRLVVDARDQVVQFKNLQFDGSF